MLPILQTLWEAAGSTRMETSLKEKLEQFTAYEEKIAATFGLEFVTKMEHTWDDLHAAEMDRAFEQGFLAAWRLWAEVCSII